MRTFRLLAAGALSILPLTGFTEGAANGYFWKGGEDTAGIGAKAWFGFGGPVFFTGRLQAGDAFDLDYNEARAGAGLGVNLGSGTARTDTVYAGAQAIRIDVEDEDDIGLGFFAGATFSPADRLTLDIEFGIVDAGELEFTPGPTISLEASEFAVNAAYALTPAVAVSIERSEQVMVGDVTQVGVRFTF
jgi:opacity protein-like surface antigen